MSQPLFPLSSSTTPFSPEMSVVGFSPYPSPLTNWFHYDYHLVIGSESNPLKLINQERKPKTIIQDFPGGAVVKNPPANAGDMGSSPGLGRSHVPRSN